MSEKIIITQGRYIASAVKTAQYPERRLKEIVFIGRSNVGKSSLINSLSRVGGLARVSGTPGKTQTINFYELSAKLPGEEERRDFYLVDLPGYGYAKTGRENRHSWSKFIDEYLLSSKQLQFVCQLIDSRHPPMPSDQAMFRWLIEHNLPVLVIATKTDKLSQAALRRSLLMMRSALLDDDALDILPYSSVKGEGRSELLDVIGHVLVE